MKLFVEVTIPQYNKKKFREDFRLRRRTYYECSLQLLAPVLGTSFYTGRKKMNLEKQLRAVLWLLATPDSYELCIGVTGKEREFGLFPRLFALLPLGYTL